MSGAIIVARALNQIEISFGDQGYRSMADNEDMVTSSGWTRMPETLDLVRDLPI